MAIVGGDIDLIKKLLDHHDPILPKEIPYEVQTLRREVEKEGSSGNDNFIEETHSFVSSSSFPLCNKNKK